jgi:hypothetical protein
MKTNLIKVPFAFIAGDKTFPAGEFRVQINLQTRETTLFNPAGALVSMQTISDGAAPEQNDALEFERFGDTWVLRQVRVQGYALRLIPSKLEKKELAELKSQGRQTLIASSAPAR